MTINISSASLNSLSMIAIIGAVFTGLYGLICCALNAITAFIPKKEDVCSLEYRVKKTVKDCSATTKKADECASVVKMCNSSIQKAIASQKANNEKDCKEALAVANSCKRAIEIAEACKEAMVVAKSHKSKCAKIILDLKMSQRDFIKDLRRLPDAIQRANNQIAMSRLKELPEDLTSVDQIYRSLLEGPKEGDPVALRVAFFQKLITHI